MNIEKAREFFSAYYEETLEKGLLQSFEQKLRSDRELRAEYDLFVKTMEDLDSLKFEEIPIPAYLNARITARLEDARTPARKQKGLVFYLPRFGIVAAAAAAIVTTIVAIPRFEKGPVSVGSIGPDGISATSVDTAPPLESIQISGAGQEAHLHYSSASEKVIQISDRNGKQLKSFSLGSMEKLEQKLSNPNPSATLFEIAVSEGGPDEMVAVPGSVRKSATGNVSGSLSDFALALADQYGKSVIVDSQNKTQAVTWNFDHVEAKDAVDHAFEGLPLEEVQTSSGVLSLKDKS